MEVIQMANEELLASMTRIRTCASWLKRTGKPIDEYPRLGKLSGTERWEAQQFACGQLPWPHKWTVRLYRIATAG
jgi:hypothetical protein